MSNSVARVEKVTNQKLIDLDLFWQINEIDSEGQIWEGLVYFRAKKNAQIVAKLLNDYYFK